MDKVVHFEIPYDDAMRAHDFYKKVFHWKLTEVPDMNYTTVGTVEVDDKMMPKESGGINGGMMKRDKVKHPVITIAVKDINKTVKDVEMHGGKLFIEKMQVGDMGFSAYIKDTEDNIIGLWQNLKEM